MIFLTVIMIFLILIANSKVVEVYGQTFHKLD